MKRHWPYAVQTLLGLTISGVLLASMLGPREPVYQGKALSYWVDRLELHQAESETAICEIGSQAVPFLLQQVHRENGIPRRLHRAIWPKLPPVLRSKLPNPKPGDFVHRIHEALEPLAPSSVPELLRALQDRDVDVRLIVMNLIGSTGATGDEAVPQLIRLVDDRDVRIRVTAVSILGKMGSKNKQAIPALCRALRDGDDEFVPGFPTCVRANAAQVLGEIGPDARASVPALRRLLVCKHDFTREQAAIALWRITRDTNVVSLLVAELDRAPNSMAYRQIVSALGEMGQPAKAAVPAVVRTIGQPGRWEDFEQYEILKVGEEALRRIDPNALLKLNGPGK